MSETADALGFIRAEMMEMVALELVVKEASQTRRGDAKIRAIAGKGTGVMLVMILGEIIEKSVAVAMS